MNEKEKAYCKHDLNLMRKAKVNSAFGMMCDELLSDLSEKMLDAMLETNYHFHTTKSELEEIAELMKMHRELDDTVEYPDEEYSADGKILFTENLVESIKNAGFTRIAGLIGDYDCIAMNGFEGLYWDFEDYYRYGVILQVGSFGFVGTEEQFFESFTILGVLQEAWGCWGATNEEARKRNFKLADEEYKSMIEEEKELAKYMASLGVYAIIKI